MKKRLLAIICTLIMCLSLATTAFAYTNHTQAEAVQWIKDRKAEGWARDYDGKNGAQCVDLIEYYFDYLVGYHLSGNAYDYAWRSDLPNGWTYQSYPTPGDIAVWQANKGIAEKWGHVALVEWVNNSEFGYVDINGNTHNAGSGKISNSDPSTFIHPDFQSVPQGSVMTSGYSRELPDGDYIIATALTPNKESKFNFLDIVGTEASAANYTNVQICGPYDTINKCDTWTLKYAEGFYEIYQNGANVCLDVDGASTARGTNVQAYQSNHTNAQKWAISRNGRNGYRLQAKCSGYSLDVAESKIDSGTNVLQWENTDNDNQSWYFIPYNPAQPIANGRYILLSGLDKNYELAIASNNNVFIWNTNNTSSKTNSFDISKLSNGYYNIFNTVTGMSLDVHNGTSKYAENISLVNKNGCLAQQWAITKNGDGYVVRARSSGYCLDVENSKTANGTNVSQYPFHGKNNQTWYFVPAEYTVSYNANGGSGAPTAQTKYYRNNLTLSSTIPTRSGYNFLGWDDSSNGTTVKWKAGSQYTKDESVTLYAVWEKAYVPVTSVTLDQTSLTLNKGETATLHATVKPDNATNKTVTWSSDNTNVATVDKNTGKVTAVGTGSAKITARADGVSSNPCTVTVNQEMYYLDVNGMLDSDTVTGNINNYGTFDMYINGKLVADDVSDYYTQWPAGTTYELQNIKVANGKEFVKIESGSRTGTITGTTKISLRFRTIPDTVGVETTTTTWNGHTYIYVPRNSTWYAAKYLSEKLGGHLVTVTSAEEETFIRGLIGNVRLWIGATDKDKEGVWKWVTNEKFDYSNWKNGEPNNSTNNDEGAENFAHLYDNDNSWNDAGGYTSYPFVCEIDSVPTVPVTSITVYPPLITLGKGETYLLSATVYPDDATDKTVTWSSNDTSVATVNNNGIVTAIKIGKAIITAKAGDKTAKCEVTVTEVGISSVTVSPKTLDLMAGDSFALTATVSPDNATNKTVTWSSSNASVATVDKNGKVTAVGGGYAEITATAGSKTAQCEVTVTELVDGKKHRAYFTVDDIIADPGETVTVNVNITKNQGIAYGLIKFITPLHFSNIKQGNWTTQGTVTSGSKAFEWYNAVREIRDTGIYCTCICEAPKVPGTYEIQICASKLAGIIDNGSESSVVSYNSGDYAPEQYYTATLTVRGTPVSSVSISPSSLSLNVGKSSTLKATIQPSNATNKTVTWKSSDTSVATVDKNGKVTAIKAGQATITASADYQTATCKVTVTSPAPKGDVNGDGHIDNTDLVNIARYVVGLTSGAIKTAVEKNADMNGDGHVDNTDLVTVARIIVEQ